MGDLRHKKSPPDDEEEDVTPEFRRLATECLAMNKERNKFFKRKKGDPGYLVSNHAELAEAIGTDKTMVGRIIGPVKPTSKSDPVDRSAFLGRIRTVLQLPGVERITVPASRAAAMKAIADVTDERFKMFTDWLADEAKRRT